jgi:hypothetical protein
VKFGIENDSGIEIEIFETLNRSQGGGKYTEQNLRNEEIAVEVDIFFFADIGWVSGL